MKQTGCAETMKQTGCADDSAGGTGKGVIPGSLFHSTVGAIGLAELSVSRNVWAAPGLKPNLPGTISTPVTCRGGTLLPL